MRPIGDKIILKYDKEQKETLLFGSLKLYIPNRGLLNENGRIGFPTVAEVVHPGKTSFKKGDLAVLVHTVLDNPAIYIETKGSIVTLTLPADGSVTIYGKLGDKGEVIPMFKHLVCRRIDEAPKSEIIITPDTYKKSEPHKSIVISAASDSKYHAGQTILYYKYSDYELCYSVNGEDKTAIMVKSEDIVGVYQ